MKWACPLDCRGGPGRGAGWWSRRRACAGHFATRKSGHTYGELCSSGLVFLFFFSEMVEPREEANPRTLSGEDLKGLIKDSLRELLHEDPTLFRAGRDDATEPATERTENTSKFSDFFSGFPVISCRLESRLAAASPPRWRPRGRPRGQRGRERQGVLSAYVA